MDDSTKRLPRASRLPQVALDHADKILADLPPLTDAQRADLSAILYAAVPRARQLDPYRSRQATSMLSASK